MNRGRLLVCFFFSFFFWLQHHPKKAAPKSQLLTYGWPCARQQDCRLCMDLVGGGCLSREPIPTSRIVHFSGSAEARKANVAMPFVASGG